MNASLVTTSQVGKAWHTSQARAREYLDAQGIVPVHESAGKGKRNPVRFYSAAIIDMGAKGYAEWAAAKYRAARATSAGADPEHMQKMREAKAAKRALTGADKARVVELLEEVVSKLAAIERLIATQPPPQS